MGFDGLVGFGSRGQVDGFGRAQVDGAREGSEDGSQRDVGIVGGMKRSPKEVDEFDIRDDLVAWRLPSG